MRLDHLLFTEKEREAPVYGADGGLPFSAMSFLRRVHFFLGRAQGELAQLARASALQAEGQGFEPPILHKSCRSREIFSPGTAGSLTGREKEGRGERGCVPADCLKGREQGYGQASIGPWRMPGGAGWR